MIRRLTSAVVALLLFLPACRATPEVAEVPGVAASTTEAPTAVAPPPAEATPTPGAPTPAATGTPVPTAAATPTAAPAIIDLPAPFTPPPDWLEPIPNDDRVIEGELANGLDYVIIRNTAPGAQASLRLVVEVGALSDPDGAGGTAHFLEHMMFNGTERFPGNEIIRVLEGFGSAFGADVNAYTSWRETVYDLTVPSTAESLQLGLDVLAQWAASATIDPAAVVDERGVIREEQRLRLESSRGRLVPVLRGALLADTDLPDKDPLGTVEATEAMDADELRAFYETWYRPDLMTVVAVGDFDSGDVERRIGAVFGALPVADDAPAPPEIAATGQLPEPVFDVFVDPELTSVDLELSFRRPFVPVESTADLRDALVAELATLLVNDRLTTEVRTGRAPALSAGFGRSLLARQFDLVGTRARVDPAEVADAGLWLLTAFEQMRQYGFDAAEFDRGIEQLTARRQQRWAERETRQDFEVAEDALAYVLNGERIPGPDDELELSLAAIDSLTPDDAVRYVHELLESPPYLLVTAPDVHADVLPGPEELAALWDAHIGREVSPPEIEATTLTELMARPEGTDVRPSDALIELRTDVFELENGARLAVRRSTVTENRVAFRGVSLGGHFADGTDQAALLPFVSDVILTSGFESVPSVDLDRLLSSSVVELSAGIGRTHEQFSGEASADDLEVLFQLVHLAMTEPTVDPVVLRQWESRWRPLLENPEARPSFAADLQLWELRYGDSPWFRRAPTLADLDSLDPDALLEAWKARFGGAADFDFLVVGDVDLDVVVDLAGRYLATIPAGPGRESVTARDPGLPEENRRATIDVGVGEQGLVTFNWESPYPFTIEAEVAAAALELVVNARLRDRIREQLGGAYSPRAAVTLQAFPEPWIDTSIDISGDPARIPELADAVREELAALRDGAVDPGYLERAIEQLRDEYRFFSNGDWLDLVEFHLAHPDRPDGEYQRRGDIAAALTIADLTAAATAAFPPQRSIEVRVVPE